MLLVEDSRVDAAMLRRALERDPRGGWELEVLPTAERALAWLEEHPLPDVVVMDLRLPGMDGLGLLRAVRQQYGSLWPAVVLLTGTGSEQVAVDAMKAGAQDYLVKDRLSAERLRQGLYGAVESVRMREALEQHRKQLERAERAAREALSVRDELFSLATHDLKGPLQSILLGARLLRRLMPEPLLAAEAGTRLEQILRATRRMGELIDHFLEVTRGGEQPLHHEPMDLLELVQAKLYELTPMAGKRPLRLDVKGRDFTGVWDCAALERVLDNLLSNAFKYSPPGSPITLCLVGEQPTEQVELRVEDQGIGIAEEDLPFIFTRFHRGRNVEPGTAGSGVGLASALRLAEQHGGTLSVQSREGQGSTFTLRLPRRL